MDTPGTTWGKEKDGISLIYAYSVATFPWIDMRSEAFLTFPVFLPIHWHSG